MDIIVAKYNEDVTWINELSEHNVLVYNKDSNDTRWKLNLINYGKDAETHLYHIVNNYDTLAEHTAFLQGNPFDHCPETLNLIKNFNTNTDYLPLGIVYKRDNKDFQVQTRNYCIEIGMDFEEPFFFIAGMQIILSKKQIHKRTRDFYVKLKESIPKVISRGSGSEGNSNVIWTLEYSWPTVFNINQTIYKYI